MNGWHAFWALVATFGFLFLHEEGFWDLRVVRATTADHELNTCPICRGGEEN